MTRKLDGAPPATAAHVGSSSGSSPSSGTGEASVMRLHSGGSGGADAAPCRARLSLEALETALSRRGRAAREARASSVVAGRREADAVSGASKRAEAPRRLPRSGEIGGDWGACGDWGRFGEIGGEGSVGGAHGCDSAWV